MSELGLDAGALLWVLVGALPLLLVACTPFAKLSIVLGALRIGLSAELLLPMGVVLVLSLLLTVIAMTPVLVAVGAGVDAAGGWESLATADLSTWLKVLSPWIEFLRAHCHPEELEFFSGLMGAAPTDPRVLLPAFLVSELAEALTMTVLLLVPFVLIDLIVAQLLVLLEMPNLPPKVLALPAKLLLFLAAGGWDLLLGRLMEAYA